MASQIQNIRALQKKHPGMSYSDAMEKAMALTAKSRTRLRKADKEKAASKKPNWATRLKGKVKKTLKSRHSKAGKAYKEKMKSGKGRGY